MKKLETHPVIATRIKPGEDLLAALEKLAIENNVQTGMIQMIGAINRADVGIYVDGKYEHVKFEGEMEIVSGLGNVTMKEGKPFIHCHLMLADHKKNVIGGHLFPGCIVHPTAEVFITPCSPVLTRKFFEKENLWLIDD